MNNSTTKPTNTMPTALDQSVAEPTIKFTVIDLTAPNSPSADTIDALCDEPTIDFTGVFTNPIPNIPFTDDAITNAPSAEPIVSTSSTKPTTNTDTPSAKPLPPFRYLLIVFIPLIVIFIAGFCLQSSTTPSRQNHIHSAGEAPWAVEYTFDAKARLYSSTGTQNWHASNEVLNLRPGNVIEVELDFTNYSARTAQHVIVGFHDNPYATLVPDSLILRRPSTVITSSTHGEDFERAFTSSDGIDIGSFIAFLDETGTNQVNATLTFQLKLHDDIPISTKTANVIPFWCHVDDVIGSAHIGFTTPQPR